MGMFNAYCALSGLSFWGSSCRTGLIYLSVPEKLAAFEAQGGDCSIYTPPLWGSHNTYGGVDLDDPEGVLEQSVLSFLRLRKNLKDGAKEDTTPSDWKTYQDQFPILIEEYQERRWIVPAMVREDAWKALLEVPMAAHQWPRSEGETWTTLMPKVYDAIQEHGGLFPFLNTGRTFRTNAARVLLNNPMGMPIPDYFQHYFQQEKPAFGTLTLDPVICAATTESIIACHNMYLMQRPWQRSPLGGQVSNRKQLAKFSSALARIAQKRE